MDADHSGDKLEQRMNRLDKIREPDNLPTWSVIVGCLLAVLFILGSAYSQRGWAGLLVFVIDIIYVLVLQVGAKVNVFRVLWGETIGDEMERVDRALVVRSTVAMAMVALLWLAWDVLTEDTWGWFSWVGAGVAVVYLGSVARSGPRRGKGTG